MRFFMFLQSKIGLPLAVCLFILLICRYTEYGVLMSPLELINKLELLQNSYL